MGTFSPTREPEWRQWKCILVHCVPTGSCNYNMWYVWCFCLSTWSPNLMILHYRISPHDSPSSHFEKHSLFWKPLIIVPLRKCTQIFKLLSWDMWCCTVASLMIVTGQTDINAYTVTVVCIWCDEKTINKTCFI